MTDEDKILDAFRAMNAAKQSQMLMVMTHMAKQHPRRNTPKLELVVVDRRNLAFRQTGSDRK